MKLKRALFVFFLGILTFSAVAEIKVDPAKSVITYAIGNQKTLAEDLQKHLEIITGTRVPILAPGNMPAEDSFVFAVGKTPDSDKEPFKPEEARWKAGGGALYFYGDPNRGASHAVYMFLEDELGVRWPWYDAVSVREQNPLIVKHAGAKWAPTLKLRIIRGQKQYMQPWNTRLRCGTHQPPQYGHAFVQWWDKYGKTHPEYFALNYGRRQPCDLGQKAGENVAMFTGAMKEMLALCVGNEAVADQIIADWDKKSEYINLCENDAPDELSCHCDKCCALDALKPGEGFTHNLADRYVFFANRVLSKARKYRRDVKVSMYAYNASQNAPRREKPDPAVVIGVVPTDFTMDGLKKYVGDWKMAGLNRFFYRPNRHHYYSQEVHSGYEKHFFEVFQYMLQQGALGFDYDSLGPHRRFEALGDYVIFKGMQDTSKPYEYWEEHYMQAFAPADKEVGDYYRHWRRNIWEKRLAKDQARLAKEGAFYNYGRGLAYRLKDYFKDDDFAEAGKFLDQALARNDLSPRTRKLIEELQLEHEHLCLRFRAIAHKTDADSIALLRFREKHNMPLFQGSEKYYGDICGIQRVKDLGAFDPPYVKTPLFWKFRLDPQEVGEKEKWYAQSVAQIAKWPYFMGTNTPWETPHKHYKAISDEVRKLTAGYDGIAWYAIGQKIPSDWKNRQVYLYFGAVDESCKVWVNGQLAGVRPFVNPSDWATPFSIEITGCIDWNKPAQSIVVQVQDKSGAGGIWKIVWLVSKK